MERVKKGERYWSIVFDSLFNDDGFCVIYYYEGLVDDVFSEIRFKRHNYFSSKEEAELMANKLRAVLKGADVIKMPSIYDVTVRLEDYVPDWYIIKFYHWLESKLIKKE